MKTNKYDVYGFLDDLTLKQTIYFVFSIHANVLRWRKNISEQINVHTLYGVDILEQKSHNVKNINQKFVVKDR